MSEMDSNLKNLILISRKYGKNPDYVIAGGGNTSFKNDQHLWIKASGTSLATISEEGFAKMDRNCLKRIAQKTYSKDPLQREAEIKNELHNCISGDTSKRPSVETSLHDLLENAFVVHTHPTLINGLLCSVNSKTEVRSMFGNEALYVEYTDPGFVLFKQVEKEIKEYKSGNHKEPEIIFLENHGVFVSADTVEKIDEIYELINQRILSGIRTSLPSEIPQSVNLDEEVKILKERTGLLAKAFNSELIRFYIKDENSFRKVSTAFTPDNIVYCKAQYSYFEGESGDIYTGYKAFEELHGYPPRVMGIKGKGIICVEESEKSVSTVHEVFMDILKISFLTENFGGPRFMTKKQIEFIDNWEVENYRRKVAKE